MKSISAIAVTATCYSHPEEFTLTLNPSLPPWKASTDAKYSLFCWSPLSGDLGRQAMCFSWDTFSSNKRSLHPGQDPSRTVKDAIPDSGSWKPRQETQSCEKEPATMFWTPKSFL